MYNHQVNAVEKLVRLKVGALYMEMGTGKTRTALELILRRYNKGKVNHIIWLCPFSIKRSIEREIQKHIGKDLSMFTICGIETLSSSIKANVNLLQLAKEKKCFLIVDESNLVKNHRAKRTKNIIRLAQYCPYRLILNGMPISRTEADLYAQWYILDWRILGYQSFWSFAQNHVDWDERTRGRIKNIFNVDYLTRKIAPYTYQVTKSECLDLPRKTYGKVYYNLTDEQWVHYNNVANTLLFEIDEMRPETIYRLFTGLQNVISGLWVDPTKEPFVIKNFFHHPEENPRIQALMNKLEGVTEKVIIFCRYTHEINHIVTVLNKRYGPGVAVPFNGEVKHKQRELNLQAFESSAQFFVANKTCAGYGLNLQFCSFVVYYNNDWDYATRSQSEDRVHRIGQQNNVHIIDLCADGTLDERILKCLSRKESLVYSFQRQIESMKNRDITAMKEWIEGKVEDIGENLYGKGCIDSGTATT